MISSPAFCILSLSARRVLDRLEIELAGHGGTENGKLIVTFDQFQQFGIDRHAIAPAIREAVALGFVEVTEQGRAGNAEYRQPNRFRLTYRNTDYGAATDDWRKVKTTIDATAIAQQARNPKKIPSGGLRQISVGETHTETPESPVGETHTTAIVAKPTLLSISREGEEHPSTDKVTGRSAQSNGAVASPVTSEVSPQKKNGTPFRIRSGNTTWSAPSFIGLCERQLEAGKPLSASLKASVAAVVAQADPQTELHARASRILVQIGAAA